MSAGTPRAYGRNGLMKAYAYDKVGELRQSRHSLQGDWAHAYDATGRIVRTVHQPFASTWPARGAGSEHFAYDPAGNILDAATQAALARRTQHPQAAYVHDNLVRVLGDKRFFYDGHGRLIEKRIAQHTVQRFEWDEENRLTEVITTRRPGTAHAITQTTRFDYDALGRRVAKHDAFGTTAFIWEGMRLIEERRGSSVISYVYEPGSYVPLARLDALGEHTAKGGLGTQDDVPVSSTAQAGEAANDESVSSIAKPSASRSMSNAEARYWASLEQTANEALDRTIEEHWGGNLPEPEPQLVKAYYFHTDQVGLPEELTNAQGQIVWQASYKTWGNTVTESWEYANLDGTRVFEQDKGDMPSEEAREQNLRFQGQYLDRDTGLHYNTFRYYDPDLGRFISPDPIGLFGGHNLHSYAPNPVSWIDPWGLLNEGETAGFGSKKHSKDGLEAHEILRNKKVQEVGIGNGRRVKGNPSMALSPKNHDAVHLEENRLRRLMGLGPNDMLRSGKLEIRLMSQAIYNSLVKTGVISMDQLRIARRMSERWAKSKGCF